MSKKYTAFALALLFYATTATAATTLAALRFREVSTPWGLAFRHHNGAFGERFMVETMGSGVVLFDYDGDGDLDVYWIDSGRVPGFEGPAPRSRLHRNDGPGRFVDVADRSGLATTVYAMGGAAADIDGDGDLDLLVTGWGGLQLFENLGDGTFADSTARSGLANPLWTTGATFADLDRDGDLDLYLAAYVHFSPDKNYFCGDRARNLRVYCPPVPFDPQPDRLYRNRGDGTFGDWTAAAGIADSTGKGLGVVATDLDGDGWLDLYVANDTTANFLFRNRGKDAQGRVTFEEQGVLSGVAYDSTGDAEAGMGIAVADAEGDGRPDLFVTNFDLETNALYGNLGGLLFTDRRFLSGLAEPSFPMVGFGAAFADFDLDGDPDLVVANGHIADNAEEMRSAAAYRQRNQLFENLGGGRFAERRDAGLDVVRSSRGLAVGDLDGDLDLDVAISNSNDAAEVYENLTAGAGKALAVRLEAAAGNRFGIGARVEVEAAGRRQAREVLAGSSYLSQDDLALTFGLGGAGEARLTVAWPSGARQHFEGVPAGKRVVIVPTRPPPAP